MRILTFCALLGTLVLASLLLSSSRGFGKGGATTPETDSPGEAHAWRMLAWKDDHGNIPQDGLRNALAQRRANLAYWDGQVGIQSMTWTSLGPTNVAGRTRSLVIDYTNPNILYAGAVGGGVWKSIDRGQTWMVTNDWLDSIAIGSLTIDPHNHNVLYAGTGEGVFSGPAIRGAGVYKSVDGGNSWVLLTSTASWAAVNAISIHPTNSNVLLASVSYRGIQRSTDGGQTWVQVLSATNTYSVEFSSSNPDNAIASLYSPGNNRAVYSTDSGLNWTVASGLTGIGQRIAVQYAPSDNSIVYGIEGTSGGRTWRSTDGGHSFIIMGTGNPGTYWYCNPLWIDPTNPNVLVSGAYNVWKSTNGGATWNEIGAGYLITEQPHPDQHYVIHDPNFNGTTNRRVYVCNDGGVFCTDNIYTASTSAGWYQLNQGYVSTQFYDAAGNASAQLYVGGTQDNGTLHVQNGSTIARQTYGGDGGVCAIDPTNPSYIYGEYVNLRLFRSTDGGSSAYDIYAGLTDAGTNANFIAPFILSPAQPGTMFAGGRSLWRSTNVRATNPTWSAVRPGSTDNISAIAGTAANANLIWVGQNNGVISKTGNAMDAAPTWSIINLPGGSPNPLPNRFVGRILIDPNDVNTVYVGFGGFTANNLWKTTDGGTNWTSISGSGVTALPNAPIRGLACHPDSNRYLYAATEVGVFKSTDGGATWSTNAEGPASVCTYDIEIVSGSRKLIAATHGRGMWTADLDTVRPHLTSLSPTSVTAGGGSFTLTVNGAGFFLPSVVQFNGTGVTTSHRNGTSTTILDATIPSSAIEVGGLYTVSVFCLATGLLSDNTLTLTALNPTPSITANGLSPASKEVGSPAFTLTVSGSGFVRNSKVRWNGQDRPTTFVSSTQLQVDIGAADLVVAGTFPVTVFNELVGGLGGGESNGALFSVTNPVPVCTSLSPDHVSSGSDSFSLTITGDKFVDGAVATWNDAALTTTFMDAQHVTAQVPAALVAVPGGVTIRVENPGPGGGPSNGLGFTIKPAHKLIVESSPISGISVGAPPDQNGDGPGTTTFVRFYDPDFHVPLSQPAQVTQGGVRYLYNHREMNHSGVPTTAPIVMDADKTATLVYVPGYVLTVQSSPPAVLIKVWTKDYYNRNDGTTQFTRTHKTGVTASLTAPVTTGTKAFDRWEKNGVPVGTARTINVPMSADTTVKAVYKDAFTLTFTAGNATAVPITVYQADVNALKNGTTDFTRLYLTGSSVSFTAPQVVGTKYFARWEKNGLVLSTSATVTVSVTNNATFKAVYNDGVVLTVNSETPSSGVPITLWQRDRAGQANGTTSFTRLYALGQTVSMTAPASMNGKAFVCWKIDGTVQPGPSRTITVTMSAAKTCTAVYSP